MSIESSLSESDLPHVTTGPFEWPVADEAVLAALEGAYRDGSWGCYDGPHCAALVEELSPGFASEFVTLCSSGTIAVELALRGCGVEAGDEVVLAAYDFPGNFRAVEAVGARPVLVDVDRKTWCLSAEALEQVAGDRVKAVIVSHLHGGLADMQRIVATARNRGWQVVEDACQQPGAVLDAQPVGSCGDVGVLSFGGSKLLTAGRGGALLTNRQQIHQRVKVANQRGNLVHPLSELQAAVLLPQLSKLHERNDLRSERVHTLLADLTDLSPWLKPVATEVEISEQRKPAYFKLAWSLLPAETDASLREPLLASLNAAGVPIGAGFRGFSGRSEHRCRKVGSLDCSTALSQSTVLLHHPILLAQEKAALQVAKVLDYYVRLLAT